MLILFSLIVMRMSGAIGLNPILGRANFPARARSALIFAMSLMIYLGFGESSYHQPETMIEYGVMLLLELFFGFVLGFAMELTILVVRFASAVIDYLMGLSMAQIYDPQSNTQMTISSEIYYAFLILLFLSMDGHIRLIELFYRSGQMIPYGAVEIRPELPLAILTMYSESILMGLQFAFPLVAMEMLSEVAVGILMRVIPQINVFVVNFQVKIIVGLLMLLYLFSPLSDKLIYILEDMFLWLEELVRLMA